jgi:hypothetical protein
LQLGLVVDGFTVAPLLSLLFLGLPEKVRDTLGRIPAVLFTLLSGGLGHADQLAQPLGRCPPLQLPGTNLTMRIACQDAGHVIVADAFLAQRQAQRPVHAALGRVALMLDAGPQLLDPRDRFQHLEGFR